MRAIPLAAVLFILAVSVGSGSAGGASDAAASGGGGEGSVSSVSCAAPGKCAAGGYYTDGRGKQQALVVSETKGHWGTAIEVPGSAMLNRGGYATVNSASCAAAGECAAGGYYTDRSGNRQAFVVSEVKGRWGKAIGAPGSAALNSGGFAEVSSVSCAAPGECAAGGYYLSSIGEQAFVVSERKGRWRKAIEAPGTAALNIGGGAAVSSISCAAAGECAAGGYYASAFGQQAFVVGEKKGRWGTAIDVPGMATLNTSGGATVNSISCAAAGRCAAGGHYSGSDGTPAFVVSETNGSWGSAIEVPTAAVGRNYADVLSISCAAPGNCAAGGDAEPGAFVVSETNGSWGHAIAVPGADKVFSISCAAAGNCSAGGYHVDSASRQQAVVVSERKGRWGKAIDVPGAATLNTGGAATVNAISCAAAGECAAGGNFADRTSKVRPFVVSETKGRWGKAIEVRLPVSCVVPNVVGKPIGVAKKELNAADCGVGKITYVHSTSRKGRVLAQHPKPGKHLRVGTRIALTASKGKKPKPPKPPKPTPTTPQSSMPAKTHWRATSATLPANAATGEYLAVSVSSVSCASPGNCTAVGSYDNDAGDQEGLLLTEKKGHWATGVEAKLPANAGPVQSVGLSSVSCASAGNCTAVGGYVNGSGGIYSEGVYQGLLLTEKAGHWARGVEAPLPANAEADLGTYLAAVSCPSAKNCTAVGSYQDGYSGLLLTERAGHWVGVEARPPAGYAAYLASVSCASAGNCTAVGGSNGSYGVSLIFTEKAGRWARGVVVGGSALTSVSCAPDGGCSAVGYDYTPGDRGSGGFDEVVLLTKTHGKWRQIDPVMPDDAPGEGAALTALSCVSGGNCSAAGLYNVGIDSGGAGLGVLLSEHAGKWQRGVRAKPPKNANGAYWRRYFEPLGLSCASPEYCVAPGDYYVGGTLHVALVTKEAGTWRRGVEAPLPRDANGPAGVALSAVSCASPGSCTVVGSYYRDSSHGRDASQRVLLLDGTTKVRHK